MYLCITTFQLLCFYINTYTWCISSILKLHKKSILTHQYTNHFCDFQDIHLMLAQIIVLT